MLLRDLRYALRVYAKNKSFTLIAVLALSVGIGSNIAVFTYVNALLLRPLPYPESERLVQVGRRLKVGSSYTTSYARFRFVEHNNRTFESVAAYDVVGSALVVTVGDTPQLLQSRHVSADFFRVLRAGPVLGRAFTAEDDRPGATPVAVISHRAWAETFGGDRNVLGRSVRMSGENYQIVGVMPADFEFVPESEAWVPMRKAEDWADRSNAYLVLGRLRPGVTPEASQQEMLTLTGRLKEEQPASVEPEEAGALVTPYRERVVGDMRAPLLILLGVVACVLLIACANVANLLFARAVGRRKEIAIRLALGINRARLIKQLLTESLLLSAVSGVVGLLIAALSTGLLELWASPDLPKVADTSIDFRIALFAVGITALTGVVFGVAPALQLTRINPAITLRESGRATSGRGVRRLQAGLVSSEVAISTVLLLVAGLLLISFQKLRGVELGYEPEGVLTLQTNLSGPGFEATGPETVRVQRALERLKAIPGVTQAATVTRLPTETSLVFSFELLMGDAPAGETEQSANWKAVTPEFFEAMRIPVRSGRAFSERDAAGSAQVAVVNDAFVRKYLGGANAVGQRLVIGRQMGEKFADQPREVVGVVGDTRGNVLNEPPQPAVYLPAAQVPDKMTAFLNGLVPLSWVVRVSGGAAAAGNQIRREIAAADPGLVASNPRALPELVGGLTARQKMHTTLVGFFAAVALFLGAVGLHGVMAHSVAERRHEIGVRIALGASPGRVVWLMVRYSLKLLAPGLVVGVLLSLVSRSLLSAFLFGVGAADLSLYLVVIILLSLAALAATVGPALRATKVDPLTVIRQ